MLLFTRSGVGILIQPLVKTHQNSCAFALRGLHWTNHSIFWVVCNSKCTYSHRDKWGSTVVIPHSYMAVNLQTDLQKTQGCSGRGVEPALIGMMPSCGKEQRGRSLRREVKEALQQSAGSAHSYVSTAYGASPESSATRRLLITADLVLSLHY